MPMIKEYYKNSNTGDILYYTYSDQIKGLQYYYINGIHGGDDKPDLSGYVPMSEKKALKALKKLKNATSSS